MRTKKGYWLLLLLVFQLQCKTHSGNNKETFVTGKTFTNPLLLSGADPWVIQKNGYYYYTHTTGNRIVIWKTKNLADLKNAEERLAWQPPAGTRYSRNLWAPELHYLQGKWYIYFAADDGKNENHRLYVLENNAADPIAGVWTLKGKISDASDKWAIDGSVYEHKKKLYMVWSGWEADKNGRQDIFIASMSNPWTIDSRRVKISTPTFSWERNGDLKDPNTPHVDVNEGPEILVHGRQVFLVYSASGCWTDFYALGLLQLKPDADLLDSTAWTKYPEPIFRQDAQNGVYAPGHNSFFKSPDGKEDWILYHANANPGEGCGQKRSPRTQRFS